MWCDAVFMCVIPTTKISVKMVFCSTFILFQMSCFIIIDDLLIHFEGNTESNKLITTSKTEKKERKRKENPEEKRTVSIGFCVSVGLVGKRARARALYEKLKVSESNDFSRVS